MANEKNDKKMKNEENENMIENAADLNVDTETGEIKKAGSNIMRGFDAFADQRDNTDDDSKVIDGDVIVYNTGYDISRKFQRHDDENNIDYYQYAFGYFINDGDDEIPQTLFLKPSDEGKEAFKVLDKIFNGSMYSKLLIVKTTRRSVQNNRTRSFDTYNARVSRKISNGAEIFADLKVMSGNSNKFSNLINIFKADGVID